MRTFLVTVWGDRYEIAPLNFEQYAATYEPDNWTQHMVPRSAFEHWKMVNRLYEFSDFDHETLATARLVVEATPEEFGANLTPLLSP